MVSLDAPLTQDPFRSTQDLYFEKAAVEKHRWQTEHPFFSQTEKKLLPAVSLQTQSLLEIGCGEGGNLKLMDFLPPLTVGVDLYFEKAAFAQKDTPAARFAVADGFRLPFCDNAFEIVFLRDVLHHVEEPVKLLTEAWRVVKSGGKLVVIEPNGRNFLAWLFSALVPAEHLAKKNTPEKLTGWLREAAKTDPAPLRMMQAFPFFRALLHYQYGLPWLSRVPGTKGLLLTLNRIAEAVIPQSRWFYMSGEAVKK